MLEICHSGLEPSIWVDGNTNKDVKDKSHPQAVVVELTVNHNASLWERRFV